jgi:oligopeptide/dipeptide ABC transporter ATP-binding protein
MTDTPGAGSILEIKDLHKHYAVKKNFFSAKTGEIVRAVDGVTLEIRKGETLGLVGESGCGKSTIGSCVMGLQGISSGSILFGEGEAKKDISRMDNAELFRYSEKVQIVFQDPYSSLNPQKTIFSALDEPMKVHGIASRRERADRIASLLESVNLRADYMYRYPHEFSGGQRQRICIARSLCVDPVMLVCDEPVSALDVSIQAQVLNLLQDIQEERNLAFLFIAHDLSVVYHVSDRIAVMYLGKIMELAEASELYANPLHPYTQALFSAIPSPDIDYKPKRVILKGDVPSPANIPSGCRFHTRCPACRDICSQEEPRLRDTGHSHLSACHFS